MNIYFDVITDTGSTKAVEIAVIKNAGLKNVGKLITTTNKDSKCGLEILYDATYTLIFK